MPGHGAGFSEGSGFSVARLGQLVSVGCTEFSRGQSPYGVSMEVTPGSSGFPGEAGPGWPGMLSVPSVVPEETLEGSAGPTLVAGSSFSAVSGRPLLVNGSFQESSLYDGSSGTVSVFRCIVGAHLMDSHLGGVVFTGAEVSHQLPGCFSGLCSPFSSNCWAQWCLSCQAIRQ
ncbi:hypothetical protein E2C01_055896 [Portunus trituberculatus]|uniref:Uncharacterized protein n=1 Tax=Portunus trituberculatus TaxID=210409 RepID=A0A5B7GWG0_PORTR|nr:hypothetical protein [Portunus trituberculatus]